ncbi:MAG: AAA family ATPase [Atopobiaceae bacterium]|nr:AAA family ATPase [Atopobiaceae bacterium]
MNIVGRKDELSKLATILQSGRPEFVVLYGRRRVGKTYLINEYFSGVFSFAATGLAKGNIRAQLGVFDDKLQEYGLWFDDDSKSWLEAFRRLKRLLQSDDVARHAATGRRVVFIDEMPWFDTPKSQFLTALEYFWNDWGSKQEDLVLIVCGSATSWIAEKLLESVGGLYNRVTRIIDLQPFTLSECDEYLRQCGLVYTKRQVVEAYMILGGIPFYLNLLDPTMSLAQSVDELCFRRGGQLRNEFQRLFRSLFHGADTHIRIVHNLARRTAGLTASDLRRVDGLGGSTLMKSLRELEQCGFIRRYRDFTKPKNDAIYQLIDPFTLFHLRLIEPGEVDSWLGYLGTPSYIAWSGLAFELVCLHHVEGIKRELGIWGIESSACAWRSKKSTPGAQIDLLIDRRDDVISVCEMKFSREEFVITPAYEKQLRAKLDVFEREANPGKALHLTMITMEGVRHNAQYNAVVQREVRIADLIG